MARGSSHSNRTRMTASEPLQVGEDEDCIDDICAKYAVAYHAEQIFNSLEGDEYSIDVFY